MTIELVGIELFGFHGVLETERQHGQRFLVDLELALDRRTPLSAAVASDSIEDAVDYRDVVGAVRDVSDAHAYNLLEAFASAIAASLARPLFRSPPSRCGCGSPTSCSRRPSSTPPSSSSGPASGASRAA